MNQDFEPECAQTPMAAIAPPISVPITHSATLNFGVIGMGAVGPVLAAAWKQAGHNLVGVTARSAGSRERAAAMLPGVQFVSPQELCAQVDLLVFTVRDTELADLVENLASQGVFRTGQLVAHTAGAFGLEVLSPAAESGAIPLALHPAQTFSGTSLDLARLHGCFWAVNAPLALLPVAQALVLDIGGIPRVLADGARPLYHAALAHGANHLVTLVTQTLRALQVAGIEDSASFAQPLMKAALERALQEGEAGLSGPISRGDAPTIAKHLRALENGQWRDSEDLDPALPRDDLADLPSTYRALAAATAARILNRGGINELQYKQIEGILGNCAPARQER
ncbi:DUF2520 domain-containing protein [Mobiluncus mulieris]|uniref:NADP oxidoreductase coenzyme F420-dependent n=1 Tax=Mobiluncus mulieris ATCC 35239 TaxID=871571 RepID=E0QMH1_9ACTO|nr:DUF2520 domain-containing protein [Mobiluncus mulieris]EFM47225.1 NADP oxidoreductase coenzyme F420-dependent [Mobiluncus mulieris ATCC 35239]MCU9971539.1 DUF2520 domain-containing protein [Mobiluncus mulieris]MCU9976016.1 DUF2520 domain-containing protein [Mobiluncus mulieris]MCU9994629.1 DUF2520 domain-containing protein [Mobiluncus mulieris]MCV0012063.1 DUF2520 domain-containing protein [Mobiluncus mulieris]